MMPFVRGVILASIAMGSMFQLSASESTKTGRASQCATAFAVATNVSVGTMTSSPEPTPSALRATCNAAVPLQHEMACLTPQKSANAASNRSTYGPLDDIQVESIQSMTYAFSFPTNIGAATGINP